jgi:Helix-turn-helix domain
VADSVHSRGSTTSKASRTNRPENVLEGDAADCKEGSLGPGTRDVNLDQVVERLDRIEATLTLLVQQRTVKDWYSTEEVAHLVGRAEFTVREWCRLGRIRAEKKSSGRGLHPAWAISNQELQRFQKEGLLPVARS